MGVGRVSEWRKVTSQNPAATSDSLNQRPRIEQSGRAATMNADHHTIGGYFSRCPDVIDEQEFESRSREFGAPEIPTRRDFSGELANIPVALLAIMPRDDTWSEVIRAWPV